MPKYYIRRMILELLNKIDSITGCVCLTSYINEDGCDSDATRIESNTQDLVYIAKKHIDNWEEAKQSKSSNYSIPPKLIQDLANLPGVHALYYLDGNIYIVVPEHLGTLHAFISSYDICGFLKENDIQLKIRAAQGRYHKEAVPPGALLLWAMAREAGKR